MKTKHSLSILALALLVSACSKEAPTTFNELSEITSLTQTQISERTPDWYMQQDQVRKKVIAACFDHLNEKAELLGGSYQAEFNDDVFGKFDEFPDCSNARKGDIQYMAKGALVYEYQISDAEYLINAPQTQEHINTVARDVAKKFEKLEQDNKEINDIGRNKLEEIEKSSGSN